MLSFFPSPLNKKAKMTPIIRTEVYGWTMEFFFFFVELVTPIDHPMSYRVNA